MPKIFFLNKFNYIFTLLFLLLSFYFYSLSANAQLKASDSVPPALSELVKSAQAGDPTAQIDLGKRYASGQGIEKNRDKAKEWLEKAAEKNFGIAMLELGKLLY
ncbi:MAG: sel1 repeat family protein, partial [Alphaproteobacteria bacterium]|nr:sel1 repeat family protein [Alphaproteobacteria bacterium]